MPPKGPKKIWKISIFPTPGEIIEAGPRDGQTAIPGFQLNLGPIAGMFDRDPRIGWIEPSQYTGELDGPCIVLQGQIRRRKVHLRIFQEPPAAFAPTVFFDRISNETRLRTSANDEEDDD
jgi:hypothetical protein